MVHVTVQSKELRGWLTQQAAQMKNPRGLMAVLGRELVNLLKKHFLARDKEPNKLGGKRTHWWREVSKTINQPEISTDGLSGSVAISHPAFGHKVRGGVITAKRKRFLTIPVTAEAHGRTAGTFKRETGKWLYAVFRRDAGFLATREPGKGFTVHYLLRRSVNQKPDAEALPPQEVMAEALRKRAEAYLARINKA